MTNRKGYVKLEKLSEREATSQKNYLTEKKKCGKVVQVTKPLEYGVMAARMSLEHDGLGSNPSKLANFKVRKFLIYLIYIYK